MSTTKPTVVESFTLVFRPIPGKWLAPVDRRLAQLIKIALRGFGFRLVKCEPAKPGIDPDSSPATAIARRSEDRTASVASRWARANQSPQPPMRSLKENSRDDAFH